MADYSYAQLAQMQKEAALRVQEMRKKAKFAVEDSTRQFEVNPADKEIQQKNQNPAPKDKPCPNGKCCRKKAGGGDLLARLFGGSAIPADDADKALILSLCFLLQADGADEELILALLYLIT